MKFSNEFSRLFHCLIVNVLDVASLYLQDFEVFLIFRHPQATCLVYHGFFQKSTTFFNFFENFFSQRRRRDLNPRAAINDLLPFQGSPFSLLGTSPSSDLSEQKINHQFHWWFTQRRGWDSNPRVLADKRFSRPPRYGLFDTSP